MTPTSRTPEELAWLAGFLDGEGYFAITGRGNGVVVSVTNTYLPALEIIRGWFGGSVRLSSAGTEKHRPSFQWAVSGANAEAVCRAVLPHLREKRQQAALLIHFRTLPRGASELKASMACELKLMKRPRYTLKETPC